MVQLLSWGRFFSVTINTTLGRVHVVGFHMHSGGTTPFGQPRKGRVQVKPFFYG
jgi:hypothetical protein